MVLPWHRSDYPKVPNEDKVLDALRPFAIPPGDYMMPRSDESRGNADAGVRRKDEGGPGDRDDGVAERPVRDGPESRPVVRLLPSSSGSSRRTSPGARCRPGRRTSQVFRFVGATAFIGLRARAVADVDLVSPRLEHDDQGDRRRSDLRAAHRRHIRVAVAALVEVQPHPLSETRSPRRLVAPSSIVIVPQSA